MNFEKEQFKIFIYPTNDKKQYEFIIYDLVEDILFHRIINDDIVNKIVKNSKDLEIIREINKR